MSGAPAPCEEMRERIHDVFDGDAPGTILPEVSDHLAACGSCREMYAELEQLRDMLRHAPAAAFPATALDAVWARTVKNRASHRVIVPWLRSAAAAVVATALIATTYLLTRPGSGEPSSDQILRAEAQADLVFGYTARALTATRNAVADRVVADKIVPAVRRSSATATSGRREEP